MHTPSDSPLLSTKGMVFDLQRCSLHDGPGIRTTVFLKGCPLRCLWCHNPESQSRAPELSYEAAKCLGCRVCAEACPSQVHHFEGTGAHIVDWASCRTSGACIPACPSSALKLYGYESTVGALLEIACRDRAYYASSGGGLTLSGGEPTLQAGFCRALLTAARAEGLHTCLETCGISPRETYALLLPLTDLFLFDCKALEETRHQQLTGAPLAPILANLRWLASQGARLLLRCPVIPGLNDDEAHFTALAALSRELPLEGLELLPYHAVGLSKYANLGQSARAIQPELPGPESLARWRALLLRLGCRGLLHT